MAKLLTSCLVNGEELISYLLQAGTTYSHESGDRVGTATLPFQGVAATLGPLLTTGASVELTSDQGTEFLGRISRMEPVAQSLKPDAEGLTLFKVQCQDLMTVLNETTLDDDYNYTVGSADSDADAIQEVFGDLAPSIDVSGISSLLTTLELRASAGWTLKQFMNEVAARSGAAWYLDGDVLMYHAPSAVEAPFGIRDFTGYDAVGLTGTGLVGEILTGELLPGGADPIPVNCALYEGMIYTEEWTSPANRIIVRGKAGNGGVRVTSGVVSDASSITQYGTKSIIITDDNIQTDTEAAARAAVELDQRKQPQKSCSFKIRVDGLAVGQIITIRIPSIKVDAAFFINRISEDWSNGVHTYTAECGYYRPNSVYNQYKTAKDAQQKPYVPETIPADGSVTATKVVSINADQIDGTITAGQIGSIDISQVTGTITVAAGNITGSINFSQINGSTVSITGSQIGSLTITDANIANNTISSAKIVSLDVGKLTAGTINAAISISSGGSLDVDGPCYVNTLSASSSIDALDFSTGFGIVINSSGEFVGAAVSVSGGVFATGDIGTSGVYKMDGNTIINSSGAFVGAGVDVGVNGVGCGGVNIGGQNVVVGRQTGPGAPSFSSLSDAQTWCGNLLTALQTHGLVS